MDSRLGVDFVQKATSILLCEDASEAPRLFLQRLNVLDLDDENIAWLRGFNVEWTGQVMNLRKIDITHIICRVVVANLTTSPVNAFDLHYFVRLNAGVAWVVWVPSVLEEL